MILSGEMISGFISGFGIVLLIALFYFWKGRKERRFDERYETVHAKARTISWGITVIVLALMWLGALIYEGASLAFILLAAAYGIMLLSYGIAVFVLNKKL
ncbi:apolipoprotein N-acyltransferase [Sporosarcina luteola]|nr:apolipoprotein N-acyltransferase [Sporosarcina luteola]